ncbi:multicopper oxidase family protein [Yoonia sediminilitoris]|nr:multicopper oxidase family protein [Yoonia sediminilitoris]
MNRRHFLGSAAAAAIVPCGVLAAPARYQLRAEPVIKQILPPGDGATRMLGFNGSMPGPELRVRRGQPLTVAVENGLEDGTAIHWHGIRLDNRMDGVPMLTQKTIPPKATHTYSFVPPDAGTFWYHSHYLSHEQVALGMMGPLIIEEDTPPDVDRDITVLISDWMMQEDGTLVGDFANRHSVAHGGYMGNYAKAFLSGQDVQIGDRVRFRLINAATNRIFPVTVGGVSGQIVALDGMALATPRPLSDLILAPAQRVDLIVDVTGRVTFDMITRQDPYLLAELVPVGTNANRTQAPVPPLPPHGLPQPAEPAQHLTLTMMGGAMGGRHGGDNIWAFNNVSDLPADPFGTFTQGETARITLVNDTSFAHGIHLHGHHFFEVGPDGALGDLRDTTLVSAGESRDILCVFDNPGKWLLHCHMLSHQVGGMKTWVSVA